MSAHAMTPHGHASHSAHAAHHDAGPTTALGFWIYLMSDCILFAALFATYAVLSPATAGGPTEAELFELPFVLVETFLLLLSSVTFGFGMLAAVGRDRPRAMRWFMVTFLLGAGFLAMELYEFNHLIHIGAGPSTSAFLSAFFTLVGTHGLHVTFGMIWLATMMVHVMRDGFTDTNLTRLNCLSMFWHFLDVIWIGVFTLVYLMGAL
ncbi:cytochrome o ubiquinol oxidase subunit III [Teichococcus vastitatis]|nr:cytochrome o ubiquinol oxidase subunit III [Pseudoroseomonas vastitatis]